MLLLIMVLVAIYPELSLFYDCSLKLVLLNLSRSELNELKISNQCSCFRIFEEKNSNTVEIVIFNFKHERTEFRNQMVLPFHKNLPEVYIQNNYTPHLTRSLEK